MHFISKCTDADMENSETQVWLDFALACHYVEKDQVGKLKGESIEIGKMVNHMINNSEKYGSIKKG